MTHGADRDVFPAVLFHRCFSFHYFKYVTSFKWQGWRSEIQLVSFAKNAKWSSDG